MSLYKITKGKEKQNKEHNQFSKQPKSWLGVPVSSINITKYTNFSLYSKREYIQYGKTATNQSCVFTSKRSHRFYF